MKRFEFNNVDERNAFLVSCYVKGIQYSYYRANVEGVYVVLVNSLE